MDRAASTDCCIAPNPKVLSVATATPEYQVDQATAKEFARETFQAVVGSRSSKHPEQVLERFLRPLYNAGVEYRHFCVPPGWFAEDHTWAEKNAMYKLHAAELAAEAARGAIARAKVRPEEVGAIVFVSSTGIKTPTIASDLIEDLGLSPHAEPHPLYGWGCSGGAAGLSHAADLARLQPGKVVLFIAVELCGLGWVREDVLSPDFNIVKAALIATALFSDGAAAAVIGQDGEGPQILGGHSTTWPGTRHYMGWRELEAGLGVILDKDIPNTIRQKALPTLREACHRVGVTLEDLDHLVVHPGSSGVLDAFEEILSFEPGGLALSREVLREHGNMSSVTVLFILERLLESEQAAGELGVVSALGPGFRAHHTVFRT